MKKLTFVFLGLLFSMYLMAQPFIMGGAGNGLGQYGYLENDASTFANLNRDNYNNIKHLGARWWVTDGDGGQEYVYWTTPNDGNWQCSSDNSYYKPTNNYNSGDFNGEWAAGSDCYVSVYSEYCDNSQNTSGFNEKHFIVLDFDNTPFSGIVDNVVQDAQGNCNPDNLVASFTIDPGSQSNIDLERFWFKNIGTAMEGTDIPNDAFKVFYESATGSESFDGTESSFPIYGDYNSNSTSNNEFGNDNVSASISGKTRFYVTMCKINLPSASGKTVELVVLNDGISFNQLDGRSLFRIGETNISNKAIILPIKILSFNAKLTKSGILLNWNTTNEINSSHFNLQRSSNTITWSNIGKIQTLNNAVGINYYKYIDEKPLIGINYYRLLHVDIDGVTDFSKVISISQKIDDDIIIYPNPVKKDIHISSKREIDKIIVLNSIGSIINVYNNTNIKTINLSKLKSGIYRIIFNDKNGIVVASKSFIKL